MSNDFWQNKQENKMPWGQEKEAPIAEAPPAIKITNDKPWPQEAEEQQSANELLALASAAEIEANRASEAARTAMQAAKAANSAMEAQFDSHDQRVHKAKEEAAQQAVLASQAALSAQLGARDSAAGAVSQAEAELEKALLILKNSEKELSNLDNDYQVCTNSAEEANEIAAIARQKAEQETARYQATKAAFLAAQILKEQASMAYENAQKELVNAKQLAQDANLKLASLQQQHLKTKEETALILSQLSSQPPAENETLIDGEDVSKAESAPEQQAELGNTNSPPEVENRPSPITVIAQADTVTQTVAEPDPFADITEATTSTLKHAAHAAEDNNEKQRNIGRTIVSIIILVAIAIGIAFALRAFVFEITVVNGYSMVPTLQDGDRLFTSKISYLVGEPERGDIVVIDAPDKEGEYYIKRIVGLPNEQITIQDGKVYINNELYEETYLSHLYTVGQIDLMIEDGAYFVMGDNRDESHDSRDSLVGTITKEHIRGKSVFRITPFSDFGSLYK